VIHVRMMPLLAKRARSRLERREVTYAPGCTPAAILSEEGFSELDQEAITALVNDVQVELDQPLADEDRLELIVGIQGGAARLSDGGRLDAP
jgi:sulfur carrier protein ThiS